MNTSITVKEEDSNRWLKPLSGVLIASLLGGLTACSTTRQVTKGVEPSGFLANESQLEKGKKGQADLVYINPSVDWAKYTKVYIEPVQLWKSEDKDSPLGKLSKDRQQMLVSFLHTSLSNSLSKEYEIVDTAGPDVLIVRVAITEGKRSWPVVDLVSSVYPAAVALSYGKQLIWGTGTGVGMVTIEGELLDGATQQRLAAEVDARSGTKALRTKFDGTWGDAKLCFDWWSQHLATFLADERAGKPEKTEL